MTAIKHPISGAWLITDVVAGHLMQRVYYGYTKKEAMRLFKEEASTNADK